MKKNGFTLIELLAVIVILAIIALIATPIILGIINDAREESYKRSAELYLSAVDLAIAKKQLSNPSFKVEDKTYSITKTGDICLGDLIDGNCNNEILKIELDGTKPDAGKIEFKNKKIVSSTLTFGDKTIEKNNEGNIKVVDSLETRYNKAKKSGDFVGTYDKYVLEEEYGISYGAIVNYEEPQSLGYTGTWRVLGVNDDGQVMLVSSNTIGDLELAGKDGYNNGIKKLNDMSSPYADGTNGVYGRSIKMSDLNELIDYDPSKQLDGKPYGYGTLQEYGVTVTYKKIGDNTFEMTRVKADGTKETTTETFEVSSSKTGEFLDINSATPLGLNESITMNFANNYYQYAVSNGTKTDILEQGRYVYTFDDTSAGKPEREGYKEIFLTENITKYWLADKSDLAHNGGSGWGIMFCNVMSNWGNFSKATLYHSTKYGDTANGLGAGEFSETYGVRTVIYLNSKLYFSEKADGTYDLTTVSPTK